MTTYTITFSLRNSPDTTNAFQCASGDLILDAAEEAGFEWPYAGRSGSDSSSAAKLVSGKVDQSGQTYLSPDQIAKGFILTDSAFPLSNCKLIIGVENDLN